MTTALWCLFVGLIAHAVGYVRGWSDGFTYRKQWQRFRRLVSVGLRRAQEARAADRWS